MDQTHQDQCRCERSDDRRARGTLAAQAREKEPQAEKNNLEKCVSLFAKEGGGAANLFGFIDAEKASYPVSLLCRALKVSRSGWRWARAV